MRPLYVCTVVFSRYDCLRRQFESVAASTRRPDGYFVIDHGYDESKIRALEPVLNGIHLEVVTLEDPGGTHASNWFLKNVPDDRIGAGDDVIYEPECLEIMARTEGDVVIPEGGPSTPDGDRTMNPSACMLIRESCVRKIGYYDEKISPQYQYFDDTDYIRRMGLAGIEHTVAKGAHAIHLGGGSQTYRNYTAAQFEEHVRRFGIAAANYVKKWGGGPFEEKFTTPVEL